MKLETCDTIIFSDIHGQAKRLGPVLDYYGSDIRKISAGDGVDGEDTRALMDLFGENDVLQVVGNHEIVTRAALQAVDEDLREIWQSRWRHNNKRYNQYEYHTLRSYGIDEKLKNVDAAEALREKMVALGHLSLLDQAQLYYETDDFIAIHGGLTDEPWEEQSRQLDSDAIQIVLRNYQAPQQVMDPDFSLATSTEVRATDKTLITGHAHLYRGTDRVTDNGKRIRLASKLATGAPLYVWQSWDNQVVEF